MKKAGGYLLAALFVMFVAAAGIMVAAASMLCLVEALGMTEQVAGFALYVFCIRAVPLGMVFAVLFAVSMLAYGYLANRNNPGSVRIAELGAEIAGWLLKCDVVYLCATVISQLILMVRFGDVQMDAVQGPVDFIFYVFAGSWLWLILAVALVLVRWVCRNLYRRK